MTGIVTASDTSKQVLRWSVAAALAAGLHASAIAAGTYYGWWRVPVGGDVLANTVDIELSTVSASPAPQPLDAPHGPLSEEVPEAVPLSGGKKAAPEKTVDAPIAEEAELPKPEPGLVKAAEPTQKPDNKTVAQKNSQKPGRDKIEQKPQPRTAPARGVRNAQASVQATAGERPSAAAQSDYGARVMAHLNRFKIYTREGQIAGAQGLARLSVVISESGQINSAHIAQSSGSSVIDEAALATVRRASPLPVPPPGVNRSLLVRLNFGLQ